MTISQREARRLRKRVEELESLENKRRRSWVTEYPGGVYLASSSPAPHIHAMVKTARKLGHAVVVTAHNDNGEIQFYALPLSS